MAEDEWVHLTSEQLEADPALADSIARFQAPPSRAGQAAGHWLRDSALNQAGSIATYVLVRNGGLEAFYSLGMSEVELRSQHRKKLSGSHPRQGAVLILWLARAAEADCGAETSLKHAVGMSQIGARQIGAAAIALDPFDAGTEQFWRERFGFRASLTRRRDADGKERPRLWMPLFPSG